MAHQSFLKDGPVDKALDRLESAKVKDRSEGQCEVVEEVEGDLLLRCLRAFTQVHHMIFGRGKRAIGASALAEHKQAVCDECHDGIHGKVGGRKLHRVGGVVPRWTDHYRRSQNRERA